MWVRTVASDRNSRSAISALDSAPAIWTSTSRSRGVSRSRSFDVSRVGSRSAKRSSSRRVVAAGESVVAPRITRRLLDRFAGQLTPPPDGDGRVGQLTDREREVLLLMAQGLSNAEIAERLFLSEATVRTHINRILAKLELRDRVQAVVFAYETGLVSPTPRG